MSISLESISRLYEVEGLMLPGILNWPLKEGVVAARERFNDRLSNGLPPGLLWMASHSDSKYDPNLVLPGCRSVLVSFLNYYRQDEIDKHIEASHNESGVSVGKIARYARGRDYHKELGFRLKRIAKSLKERYPDEQFKSFTDVGPLDEVWLVEASGMGFRGRNGLAIIPGIGSWVVLGHILTTVDFDTPSLASSPLNCPQGCSRCIDACPQNALAPTGQTNTALCNSYLSIEHPGPIPEPLRENMANCLFGCDICQEVCPFNSQSKPTNVENFISDYAGASIALIEVLKLKDKNAVVKRFSGSPLLRTGRSGLIRNACIVAGNIGARELKPFLISLLKSKEKVIRDHATWALDRIC